MAKTIVDNPGQSILGPACILIFLVVWIASIFSPFLLVIFFLQGWYIALAVLTSLIVTSYLPKLPILMGMRQFWTDNVPRYFGYSQLLYEEDVPTLDKPTLYCVHPHGIFCMGWTMLNVSKGMEDTVFCFSTMLYKSPLFRLMSRLTGHPSGCEKSDLFRHMKARKNMALIPGGFEEASLHASHEDRLYLKKRAGFLKYAMMNGYALAPVYAFGERDTFWNMPGAHSFRLWLNSFGIPAIVPIGKWWCPLLPRSNRLKVVVGKRLQLPRIENPTKEQVKEWHAKYIKLVQRVYEDHKMPEFGDKELKIM